MTRIGNADQVLLLLRERLQRAGVAGSRTKAANAGRAASRPLDRVRALAALESLNEDDVRRALIHGLLADEFGESVGSDPALQHVVDEVTRMIRETPSGERLMDRALQQLRSAG